MIRKKNNYFKKRYVNISWCVAPDCERGTQILYYFYYFQQVTFSI